MELKHAFMKRPLDLLSTALLIFAPLAAMGASVPVSPARNPVLVELFTSEGCSSCPPADALLDELDRTQPFPNAELIVLSEHVDYWNQLGWKDPFSSAIFSARQNQYATHFGLQEVYTPQIVIDGTWQGVGGDSNQIHRIVQKAAAQPKLPIPLEASRNANRGSLQLTITSPAGGPAADVYLVLAKNHVTSYVAHGENARRTLSHTSVAYRITKIGVLKPGAEYEKHLSVDLPTTPDQTRAIIYAQDRSTGKILAVTQAVL